MKTIKDSITYGHNLFNQSDLYFGHGYIDAWDEVIAIVAHVLGVDNLTEDMLENLISNNESERIYRLFEQRVIQKIPTAYLINKAYFSHLSLYVDQRVHIPRSPMAELIESHFYPWFMQSENVSCLDLCTGSGCIAIALAYYLKSSQVVATDISQDALEVAAINVNQYAMQSSIQLLQSDLFEHINKNFKFDLIISNPPYVGFNEYQELPKEYSYEPKSSLLTEQNGLKIVINILNNAVNYLKDDGLLVLEVGDSKELLEQTFPQVPFTWVDFERGGDGVFIMNKQELKTYFS